MVYTCKAKKFQDRMSHRGSGKAVGEMKVASGRHGMAEGETYAMSKGITAKKSSYCQSKDGNGGK